MQSPWDEVEESLVGMEGDLPPLAVEALANLKSTHQGLSAVLQAADWQYGERIEALISERYYGGLWEEEISPVILLCLQMRLEWAMTTVDGLRVCGKFGKLPRDLAYHLLVCAWDDGGFSYTHESFLQKHHLSLLGEIPPSTFLSDD
jgi:hypothetical protein